MTSSDKPLVTLYYAPDNASLVVRLMMEEAGLPYKTILVDRSVNMQNSEPYLALNPDGLIPVCIINNAPVFETAAILLSLADMHSTLAVPIDDERRPQFLKYLFFLSNSLHSDLRMRFYPEKYVGKHSQAKQSFVSTTLERLHHRFSVFNAAYQESNTRYLFGTDPGIVDLYLAVCFRWAQLYPLDSRGDFTATAFAAVTAMSKELEKRPAVKRACAKEGIGGLFFSEPELADPPEGVSI